MTGQEIAFIAYIIAGELCVFGWVPMQKQAWADSDPSTLKAVLGMGFAARLVAVWLLWPLWVMLLVRAGMRELRKRRIEQRKQAHEAAEKEALTDVW